MSIPIGEVVSVKGVSVVIDLFEESNKETLFYNGEKFKGVSIGEHIIIKRGFRDIVALVQGEYLDERHQLEEGPGFVRKVELRPIGYYHDDEFSEGIKYLPMIRDVAYLMSESRVRKIYGSADPQFVIGKLLKEGLPIALPWAKLFNTHIGIFGNTGSGKSNTLSTLYTTLLSQKKDMIIGRSRFVIIDFNGEYTGSQILAEGKDKKVFNLDTKSLNNDKFPLSKNNFWDSEVLGILFKATENTQKPFIRRVVLGREKYIDRPDSLCHYVRSVLSRALTSTGPKKEFPELIREIASIVGSSALESMAEKLSWYAAKGLFIYEGGFLNGGENDKVYKENFWPLISFIKVPELTDFVELQLRMNVQLLSDLVNGYVQFDHIQPLIKRMDSSLSSLEKVFNIGGDITDHLLTVVSLRRTNQEIKKVIPLLLAKYYYTGHKAEVLNASPPDRTLHLIIDEAHNVLSMQSVREHESWKDYRLELFEEIIKEGRKFGFFLSLSSQRPADISPTIMSQIHNFFIHRVVNERDLYLLENTINTLDALSRSMIPNLAKGCAIVTGTSFDLPMVVQFNKPSKLHQPDSDDVDLNELWSPQSV